MSPDLFQSCCDLAGIEFSRVPDQSFRDLATYADLLIKWQNIQNLVSRETLSEIWSRHLADSLQVLPHIEPDIHAVLDIGSGGGLPAIPLAIMCREQDIHFVLVESNRRKASFLRMVIRTLALNAEVVPERMENIQDYPLPEIDLLTSRATASLERLFELSHSSWSEPTRALFHKGRKFGEEVCLARVNWRFDVVSIKSRTSSDGVILSIKNLAGRK